MRILHLSDTPLSGSPVRIAKFFTEHSGGHTARHIVWHRQFLNRVFDVDLVGEEMSREKLMYWFGWADLIHWHNRITRSEFVKFTRVDPKSKPGLFHVHSPRKSEDFESELKLGFPIAVPAQYHPREWPELNYTLPNIVDVLRPEYCPDMTKYCLDIPTVLFTPSSVGGKGWDDKGFVKANPILKEMYMKHRIIKYSRMVGVPHCDVMAAKREAQIGIDDLNTGSYHLSSLEFLACGAATLCYLDDQTMKVLSDLTGASWFPWVNCTVKDLRPTIHRLLSGNSWRETGVKSAQWMMEYWHPGKLVKHYKKVYTEII